jgi:hypothetical protein
MPAPIGPLRRLELVQLGSEDLGHADAPITRVQQRRQMRSRGNAPLLVLVHCGSRTRDGTDSCSRAEASVIVSRLTPHYRHTSPNRSYGAPLHGLAAKSLLSATRVPLRFGCGTPLGIDTALYGRRDATSGGWSTLAGDWSASGSGSYSAGMASARSLAVVECLAWREAGAGTASRWFIASRRRRVGVCQLSGELLELGRGRVALVATLERVEPAFAQRLVELEEQGGEVG